MAPAGWRFVFCIAIETDAGVRQMEQLLLVLFVLLLVDTSIYTLDWLLRV